MSCKYCKTGEAVPNYDKSDVSINAESREMSVKTYSYYDGWLSTEIDINFCPMCGEALTEGA